MTLAASRAAVVEPRFEPVVGAVLLVLHEIGVVIDAEVAATFVRSAVGLQAPCDLPGFMV